MQILDSDKARQADASRAEIIRTVARALAEWEDSPELYSPFAARLVDFILGAQKGLREGMHVGDDLTI